MLQTQIIDIQKEENLNQEILFRTMIKSSEVAQATNNTRYLNITLQDRSGRLDAKKWNATDEDIASLKEGNIIEVYGLLTLYKSKYQFKINRYRVLSDDEYSIEDFICQSRRKQDELMAEFNSLSSKIKDNELKLLFDTIINDYSDKYFTHPAAVNVHHSYKNGLLFHSLSVCKLALSIADNYKDYPINKDYLIVGTLLHDIGKTIELSSFNQTKYTLEGSLLGHISIGFSIIMEYGHKLNVNSEKLTVLGNIILGHHGKLEFGSPTLPATIEALIVSYADDIDSKLEILHTAINNAKEGTLTEKINFLDRKQYYLPIDENKKDKEND